MVSRVSAVNAKSHFLAHPFSVTQMLLLDGHIHDLPLFPYAVAQRCTGLTSCMALGLSFLILAKGTVTALEGFC